MDDTTIAVQLGKLAGQVEMIMRELEYASKERKEQVSALQNVGRDVSDISAKVKTLEQNLIKFEPTIDEFIDIKKKVIGAGKLGKWLWGAVATVIGIIFAVRTEIFGWLSK